MRTKKANNRRERPGRQNEWLDTIAALDKLLADKAAKKSTRMKEPLVEKTTLAALNAAYSVTLRYYTRLLAGDPFNPLAAKLISQLWQKAGIRLSRYDEALAKHLKTNRKFWSESVTWTKDTIQKAWVHLNSIRTSSNMIDPEVGAIIRQFSDS